MEIVWFLNHYITILAHKIPKHILPINELHSLHPSVIKFSSHPFNEPIIIYLHTLHAQPLQEIQFSSPKRQHIWLAKTNSLLKMEWSMICPHHILSNHNQNHTLGQNGLQRQPPKFHNNDPKP